MRKLLPALIILFFFSMISGCTIKIISVTRTEIALGTYVKIIIVTEKKDEKDAERVISRSFKMIEKLDRTFDYRPKGGELAKFNEGTVIKRESSPELFRLIEDSLLIASKTDGYFDPTLLPIIKVWGFDTDQPHLPAQDDIDKALSLVGYEKIRIKKDRIEKPPEVKLDLSGIAKGRVVDIIRDYIRSEGYDNFLIDAGGDLYVSGKNAQKRLWRIAIQDPALKTGYRGILEKKDTAIVTSGDYERFFIKNGQRYTHLFNPKTGYPNNDMKSVTVLFPETAFADAIATAIFAMGSERGFSFLMENEIEGYIIFTNEEGEIASKSTPGFWK